MRPYRSARAYSDPAEGRGAETGLRSASGTRSGASWQERRLRPEPENTRCRPNRLRDFRAPAPSGHAQQRTGQLPFGNVCANLLQKRHKTRFVQRLTGTGVKACASPHSLTLPLGQASHLSSNRDAVHAGLPHPPYQPVDMVVAVMATLVFLVSMPSATRSRFSRILMRPTRNRRDYRASRT